MSPASAPTLTFVLRGLTAAQYKAMTAAWYVLQAESAKSARPITRRLAAIEGGRA